ncbi:hypothetical protein JCM21531_59 [Acetivibrio straminisolvens JCM 21531]|uniref:Uncharacterized protein n=1 Tax=Acetivibrio straminisolvens JCM 21531 TaxID=1294263 RepID=W4V1Q5_9FIRM|nr:hypothetical protein JCM21531_59 [Acetivibrio straminisolvens JCM 21531]
MAHNEYQDLLSSEKLMKEVIKEKRIDYPRSIRYKTYEQYTIKHIGLELIIWKT